MTQSTMETIINMFRLTPHETARMFYVKITGASGKPVTSDKDHQTAPNFLPLQGFYVHYVPALSMDQSKLTESMYTGEGASKLILQTGYIDHPKILDATVHPGSRVQKIEIKACTSCGIAGDKADATLAYSNCIVKSVDLSNSTAFTSLTFSACEHLIGSKDATGKPNGTTHFGVGNTNGATKLDPAPQSKL